MKKLEAAFQTEFKKILENNPDLFPSSAAFELKKTDGGTFNVKDWCKKQPHQLRSLLQAKSSSGIYFKLSDLDPREKPFDCILMRNCPSYLVIWWNKHNDFTMIASNNLLPYKEKSITYNEAQRLHEQKYRLHS